MAALAILGVAAPLLIWVAGQGMDPRVPSVRDPAAFAAKAPEAEVPTSRVPDVGPAECDGDAGCSDSGTVAASDEVAAPAAQATPASVVAAATAPPTTTLPTAAATSGPGLAAAEAPARPLGTGASGPPSLAAGAAPTSPTVVAAGPPPSTAHVAPRVLLDERFTDNQRGWPNDQRSTAWVAEGGYRLSARQPGSFVAVGVPAGPRLRDVAMTATYRKVGGPPGGGYGLIVRDQGDGLRDGVAQGGRYYVFEAGDRGEVGVWRRDEDRWIDVLPWTPSPAVRPGDATNELTVRCVGDRLAFLVNGVEVAVHADPKLAEGSVGVFVGGDGNEVLLERLVVDGAEAALASPGARPDGAVASGPR